MSDELESLVLACRRCDSPFSGVNAELCERPVQVCKGVYLWPVTAGAQVWLEEYAGSWWKPDSMMYRWAQAYALVHAREADAFVNLTDKWSARKAILKTALRLACHRGELADAIARAYGGGKDQAPKGDDQLLTAKAQIDFAAFIARLEVHSGIPAHEWLWGKSLVSAAKAYVELKRFIAAFGMTDQKRMTDELDDALNDLQRLKIKIVERLRKAARQTEAAD